MRKEIPKRTLRVVPEGLQKQIVDNIAKNQIFIKLAVLRRSA